MDSFSKFVAFYPVRNINSAIICEVLESRYFTAYGVPKSIVSDNAKVFRSKAFYDFCFRWGIKRVNTTPYYPQGSLAERVNRNLKAALKIFHHQSQKKWNEDLHLLAFAFNTAHHESTKFCPAKLFLGTELATPLESVWDLTEASVSQDLGKEKGFWTEAIRSLRKARDQVARRYNAVRRATPFKVGDVVYRVKVLSSKGKGVSAKLELRWSKPMVITRFLKSNVVQLANTETGVLVRKAHVCQLKRYHKDGGYQTQNL
jgi:hypothetical protein